MNIKVAPGLTHRFINHQWCLCQDAGCNDFEKARLSRERQKSYKYDEWWDWYERVVVNTPRSAPLPPEIPIGILPQGRVRGLTSGGGGEVE